MQNFINGQFKFYFQYLKIYRKRRLIIGEWVIQLLFNTKWAMFQLYHGKYIWRDNDVHFVQD
jgi:hypothetical protein